MPAVQETVDQVRGLDVDQYKYGFETLIESDKAPKGLSEDTVRFISAKKGEPEWMLAWRLDAYKRWLTMREPKWAKVEYGPIDYQDLYYYSAPKKKDGPKSLDEIDPEILRTYEKLGIPLREREALLASKSRRARTAKKPKMKARARAKAVMAASPSTRCSIPSRSRPRSRPSLPKSACSSCRSRKPCMSIPSW
jgi:Fe-S cluster assembly protein SufB